MNMSENVFNLFLNQIGTGKKSITQDNVRVKQKKKKKATHSNRYAVKYTCYLILTRQMKKANLFLQL